MLDDDAVVEPPRPVSLVVFVELKLVDVVDAGVAEDFEGPFFKFLSFSLKICATLRLVIPR